MGIRQVKENATANNPGQTIVVRGGLVTIEFDRTIFTPNGKHSKENKKLRGRRVGGNGLSPQTVDVPDGKVTITFNYRNP